MPELPDITQYVEAIADRALGARLLDTRIRHPFLLRSVDPPHSSLVGQRLTSVRRQGKRVALRFESGAWLVLHLMIAGRLHWSAPGARIAARALAEWAFDSGTLSLTEAGSKRRASVVVLPDDAAFARADPGGIELLETGCADFAARLVAGNHTLKRSLTDPRSFSGIGGAYSDEILHRARLSPVALSRSLAPEQVRQLYEAARSVLVEWTERLRMQRNGAFPQGVTAFRAEMAVHGRYGKPCPVCGTAVQRIRYADNETNYCPRCQTGGRVLADRSLSRLLKQDWPRRIEELED